MEQFLKRIQDRLEQFKYDRGLFDHSRRATASLRRQKEYKESRESFSDLFDKTLLQDIKNIAAKLGELLNANDVILKLESKHNYAYFHTVVRPIEPFISIALEKRQLRSISRWSNNTYLHFESDVLTGKVKLYRCNESNENIYELKRMYHSYGKRTLYYEFELRTYDLNEIFPYIEDFIDKELEQIAKYA